MRATLCFVLLVAAITNSQANQCHVSPVSIASTWVTMQPTCVDAVKHQVQMEVSASLQYLAMAAHFSRDAINRPGFAQMFFDSADEERGHAIKLIEYLLMRGELVKTVTSLIQVKEPAVTSWKDGVEALEKSLELETKVTKNIWNLAKTCEEDPKFNDYHFVDYLTGEFLQEQYESQRDFAGKVSNLKKMNGGSAIAEFLFDKKLMGVDV